jgi:hypothetical protein
MKSFGIALIIGLAVTLGACGGGSNNSTINGTWTAGLTDTSQNTVLAFTATFTQGSGTSVNITNLTFSTQPSGCFDSISSATGTFALSGNANGNVTGTFGMAIVSGPPTNTLTLSNGQVANNTISGTWTLTGTGSGCTGSGTFTMNPS